MLTIGSSNFYNNWVENVNTINAYLDGGVFHIGDIASLVISLCNFADLNLSTLNNGY